MRGVTQFVGRLPCVVRARSLQSAPYRTPTSREPDATDWVTTAVFPISIPYTYAVQDPACVKQKLPAVAGAGKTLATLSCN